MAAMNSTVTGKVASKCNDALKNIMAMTVQTSNAVVVQSVMARLINLARRDSTPRSTWREATIASGVLQALLEDAGAVDDPAQSVGHDDQYCADRREEKHRRHGELDGVRDGQIGEFTHQSNS